VGQYKFRCAALPIVILGALLQSAGQDSSPASSAAGPSAAASPSTAPEDREVSWKLLLPNVLHDQKTIWLFPKAVAQGRHLKPTIAVIFVTAGLVALDPHDTPYFRRTQAFTGFNKGFSGRNTALGTTIFPLSFYLAGLARKDSYAQRTALLAGEAVGDAEILTTVMKNVDRRLRPSDIPPNGDFDDTWFRGHGRLISGRGSFPSGHTIAAFSIATIFSDRYPTPRWHRWVAFGLAGLVGFSRVTLQSHFPSDVFAGAALGYVIGHYAVLRRQ
jgi:membrane-associated phospholipid phosphatase